VRASGAVLQTARQWQRKQRARRGGRFGAATRLAVPAHLTRLMWETHSIVHWSPLHVRLWVSTLDPRVEKAHVHGAVLEQRGLDGQELRQLTAEQLMVRLWVRQPPADRGGRCRNLCGCALAAVQIRSSVKALSMQRWTDVIALGQKQQLLRANLSRIDKASAAEIVPFMSQYFRDEITFSRVCGNVTRLVADAVSVLDKERIQGEIMEHGTMRHLLKGMQRYEFGPGVQETCCDALGALASKNHTNKQKIFDAGGMSYVLHALLHYASNEAVQRAGCHALHFICQKFPEGQEAVRKFGGVVLAQDPRGAFLRFQETGEPTVRASAHISKSFDAADYEAEGERSLAAAGPRRDMTPRRLLCVKRKFRCAYWLGKAFEKEQDTQFVDAEASLAAMQNTDSPISSTATEACNVLAKLALTSRTQQAALGVGGGVTAVTVAIENANRYDDPKQLLAGCFALSQICSWTCPETQDGVTARTVDAVVLGMQRHTDKHAAAYQRAESVQKEVQEEARHALVSLANQHPINTALVLASNADEHVKLLVKNLFQRPGDSAELEEAAVREEEKVRWH
jgi:hypothetical protein